MIRYLLMPALLLLQSEPPSEAERFSPEQGAKWENRFLSNVRQITFDGKCGEGYFSPDEQQIIFQSIRGGFPFYQIYHKDLATDIEKRVSTGHGRTTCAFFHPFKPKIIYASSHLNADRDTVLQQELQRLADTKKNPGSRSYAWSFDPYMDIFEADLDGSNLKRLTSDHGYDAECAFSPDGRRIAFCSFRTGEGDIYVMDADGSAIHRITDEPGYEGGPFFSPDGKRIIYRGEVPGKPDLLQLFVIDADGTGQRQLTNNHAVNFGPYWHPDGEHVIYATSLHGHRNYELHLLNIATGQDQRVTYTPGADVLPVFSPNGKKLMWTSRRGQGGDRSANSQLFLADWVHPTASNP